MRLRAADFHWYHLTVREAFLDLMSRFDPDAPPPDPEPNADHGKWGTTAAEWFESRRAHLVRVAGMRKSQIARLAEAGITTMKALAATKLDAVNEIGREVFPRLARQARLQIVSAGKPRPEFEILRPDPVMPRSGLALLPPASPGDVYLDLEGFPLIDDGLEYLFEIVTVEKGEPRFQDWWAHDAADRRVKKARKTREVTHRPLKDQLSLIKALLPADCAVTVFTLIDLLAGMKVKGDDRVIGERRADALSDLFHQLLTHGHVDLRGLLDTTTDSDDDFSDTDGFDDESSYDDDDPDQATDEPAADRNGRVTSNCDWPEDDPEPVPTTDTTDTDTAADCAGVGPGVPDDTDAGASSTTATNADAHAGGGANDAGGSPSPTKSSDSDPDVESVSSTPGTAAANHPAELDTAAPVTCPTELSGTAQPTARHRPPSPIPRLRRRILRPLRRILRLRR